MRPETNQKEKSQAKQAVKKPAEIQGERTPAKQEKNPQAKQVGRLATKKEK